MAVRARMEDVDVPEVSCRLYVRAGGGKVLYKLYCIPLYCIPQSPPRAKSLPVSGFPQCLPQHAQRSATPSPTLPHDAGSVQPRWPLLLARTFTMSSSACSAPSSGFPPTLPYSGAAAWCTRCCHTYFLLCTRRAIWGLRKRRGFCFEQERPTNSACPFFRCPRPSNLRCLHDSRHSTPPTQPSQQRQQHQKRSTVPATLLRPRRRRVCRRRRHRQRRRQRRPLCLRGRGRSGRLPWLSLTLRRLPRAH